MSTRALTWVFYNVQRVRAGAKLVLLAIADNADDDGDNAWPSIATLARKANMDPRTVQRTIKKLEQDGLLTVRRGAGPNGTNYYCVRMPQADGSVGDVPSRPSSGEPLGSSRLRPVSSRRSAVSASGRVADVLADLDGVLAVDVGVDKSVDGVVDDAVDRPGLVVDRGLADCRGGDLPGAARSARRGGKTPQGVASVPPEPPIEHPEPPPRARTCEGPDSGQGGDNPPRDDGGEGAELRARRVLADLGPGWPLAPRDVEMLVPATKAALHAGWRAAELIDRLSANPDGVRSPAAVLAIRLRELRGPTSGRTDRLPREGNAKPDWCRRNTCDPISRIRDEPGIDRLFRCPDCHPAFVVRRHDRGNDGD